MTQSKRTGRIPNQWGAVSFADIASYIRDNNITQTDFAESVGVTVSTFHNWKKQRCAPDAATQEKILTVIGKKGTAMAKKKVVKAKKGGILDALKKVSKKKPGRPKKTAKKAAKKTKKVTKKAKRVVKGIVDAKPKKKRGRPRKSATKSNGNGAFAGWNGMEHLAMFLKVNGDKSADDIKNIVEKVDEVKKAAALFA